ncbi:hypothetical protein ACQP1K_07995 [Sphaerimonospora sp. CA-214678]|uniref:hypothetical protein n=1 Tax=Sphaerimonospora sp. CA-214678 TaxID=3240029 RepID=UPI003D9310B3
MSRCGGASSFPGDRRRAADPPLTGVVVTREQRQLAALEQTYPAWRITLQVSQIRWWATRYRPPTLAQIVAGMVARVARLTGKGLAAALAVQDELTHRTRST